MEFFSLAEAGDRVAETTSYADIVEKSGRSGTFVLTTTETTYATTSGRLLARVNMTVIRR